MQILFGNLKKKRKIEPSVLVKTKPITTDDRTDFSEQYEEELLDVEKESIRNCNKVLYVQDHRKSSCISYLRDRHYFVSGRKIKKNNCKQIERKSYRMRCTYFNGGKALFPFDEWSEVFRRRYMDRQNNILSFDNDFAYSDEGIRLFIELDYRSKHVTTSAHEMEQHSKIVADVVRKYFTPETDTSYWLLVCDRKVKYLQREKKPLLASGCHIIFPHVVIRCEQGKQICHSANLALEREFKLRNVVDDCYKTECASLRPIFSHKITDCLMCHNDDQERRHCEICAGRGIVVSHSVYQPYVKFGMGGQVILHIHKDAEKIQATLCDIFSETSIVPKTPRLFTPNYHVPPSEPLVVPQHLRSKNSMDQDGVVFKKDRVGMRKLGKFSPIHDERRLQAISGAIGAYHVAYANPLVSSARENKKIIIADLKSRNRTFCRIHKFPEGMAHNSNRVFFIFNKRHKTINQSCYDPVCRRATMKHAGDTLVWEQWCSMSKAVFYTFVSDIFK
jgi:hypothetical protein